MGRATNKGLTGGACLWLLALTLWLLSMATPAAAAQYTWAGSGAWTTSGTNWGGDAGSIYWDSVTGTGNNAAFDSASTPTITVSGSVFTNGVNFVQRATLSGGTVNLVGTDPSINLSVNSPTISSALRGTSGVRVFSTGGTARDLTISGANTGLSGDWRLNSGVRLFASGADSRFGSGDVWLDSTSANVDIGGATFANNFNIQGANNSGAIFIRSNAVLNGAVNLLGNASLTGQATGTFNGVIGNSSAGDLTFSYAFNSPTSFVLANANTLTGTTIIRGNTLYAVTNTMVLAHENALQSSTLTAFNNTTSSFAAMRFSSNVASGQFTLGGLGSGTGTLSLQNNAGTPSAITLRIGNNNQSTTFGGELAGLGSLTKIGTGRLTLSASNSYAGATTIVGGTLALGLTGSFNSSPTITVGNAGSSGAVLDLTAKTSGFTFGSGQTVKGIGTIRMASGQALTLNGTLAAGNSPGTLTIEGGNLVLGGSSITSYEISGTDNTAGSGINDLTRVAGSLTLGGTLNVAATPSFDVFGSRTYRVFDYATGGSGALAGSMSIGTTPDANYLYSLNTATAGQVDLFMQRKAEQAATLAYSQPTAGTVNAFTNTNVSFSGTLANLTPAGGADLAVSLAGNGGQVTVGSLAASSGSSVAAGSSATVTGQIATGTSLGSRTWSVVNTDSGAIGSQTSTANGVVNLFAHGTPTLSGTSINFGYVLVGTSTSQSLTVSNGAIGSPVSDTAGITWTSDTLPGGFTGGGANSTSVIASGSGGTYSFTLATGSAGASTGSQTFSFADDSSILGSGSLGTQSVSLAGTVLDPATAILSGGITSGTNWGINLGEHNQGAGVFTQGFSISNLLQTLGYTADLDLLSFTADPLNTGALGISLTGTSFETLAPGGTNSYQASLSLGAVGGFTNVYNLSFGSSKNNSSLGGTPQNVQLTLTGVIIVPEPSTVLLAGVGIAAAVHALRRRRTES